MSIMKLPLLQKACLYRLTLVTVTDEYGEMCGIGWSYKGRAMEEINRYISIDKHKKAQLHLVELPPVCRSEMVRRKLTTSRYY